MSSDITSAYDTIVIGAGQAGPALASTLAARGERAAVIEVDRLGGTCLNSGCRPTKAMRASARAAHVARTTAAELGVRVDGDVSVDLPAIVARKDRLIDDWRAGSERYFHGHDDIDVIDGRGRFVAPDDTGHHRVEVGDRVLRAPRVIINTGARSVPPPIAGLDDVPWLDHHGMLDLTDLPDHLVVIGGSYIGLEFGQMFSRFGSHVTVLEHGERIIGREDPDISAAVAEMLVAEGLDIRADTRIERVEQHGDRIDVVTAAGTLDASHVLVAAGRVPNSDDLGLDAVGVSTDERGYIDTDEVFATSVPGIYAVGDVNGRGAFTHTAFQDYEILADHLAGGDRTVAGRVMTYALFTDPPLGRVGLTSTQAREQGLVFDEVTFDMESVTRAALDGETAGCIRLLVERETRSFLGAAMFGASGDELVQMVSLMMHAGVPATEFDTWLPVHPTVGEFFPTITARLEPS